MTSKVQNRRQAVSNTSAILIYNFSTLDNPYFATDYFTKKYFPFPLTSINQEAVLKNCVPVMSAEDSIVEKVRSPLHKLQKDISKDLLPSGLGIKSTTNTPIASDPYYPSTYSASGPSSSNDNESVYSFESVSTNGRLLDRLDLDLDELNYDEEFSRKRDSYVLIHSAGRISDRFGLDEDQNIYQNPTEAKVKPVRASSSISLERMRIGNGILSRTHSQSTRMPLKSTTYKTVLRKETGSVVSLRADVSNLSHASSSSLVSVENLFPPIPHMPMRLSSSPSSNPKLKSDQKPGVPEEIEALNSSIITNTIPPPVQSVSGKRNISSSSNASNTSIETLNDPIFNPNLKFDYSLEKLVKTALQAKAQGNLREASYQLQTIANIPHNYPKAMYLYGKALKLGQGVKLNERHAAKWFSRCILVSFIVETITIDATSMNNYVSKLSELDPQECVKMVKKNIESEVTDPFELFEKFSSLLQLVMNKLIQNNLRDSNAVGGSYYQLGEFVLQGVGSLNKDEITGRMFLTKAASLGSAEAMVKLGELWSTKSKHFKKDLYQAAAWLRLGEHFDMKIIGNSWIYKEKYVLKGKSKK